MDEDNEGNDTIAAKSLKKVAMILNGEDKRSMHSIEISILPKTLISSKTKELDEENSMYCQVCGLHRSVNEFV